MQEVQTQWEELFLCLEPVVTRAGEKRDRKALGRLVNLGCAVVATLLSRIREDEDLAPGWETLGAYVERVVTLAQAVAHGDGAAAQQLHILNQDEREAFFLECRAMGPFGLEVSGALADLTDGALCLGPEGDQEDDEVWLAVALGLQTMVAESALSILEHIDPEMDVALHQCELLALTHAYLVN